MNTVIKVENLGKKYIIGHEGQESYTALRDVITNKVNNMGKQIKNIFSSNKSNIIPHFSTEEFWALKDISFEVNQGDRIGIIGRNGAGKSTFLKIVSRITEPTAGIVKIKGRVASLLEVGTGFHPELTGRENIFLNGAILGMSRAEVKKKFDEIVNFAEIEKFLDTPVKRYSSGMYVRLAFAVAAHLETEILVVDEVLAVGDLEFQKKCLAKMGDISEDGRTLLFVSHNMGAISELCAKTILLNKGNLKSYGETSIIISEYIKSVSENNEFITGLSQFRNELCEITRLMIFNDIKERKKVFDINENIYISVRYKVTENIEKLQITATVIRGITEIFHSFHTDEMDDLPSHTQGVHKAILFIPKMFLKAGNYRVRITAGTPEQLICDIPGAILFDVREFSINTQFKGFREDRPGNVIFPGKWLSEKISDS